jgi:hypothetical protein
VEELPTPAIGERPQERSELPPLGAKRVPVELVCCPGAAAEELLQAVRLEIPVGDRGPFKVGNQVGKDRLQLAPRGSPATICRFEEGGK